MLSCEIGFSPVKCKHTERRRAATTSNLHSNFPLAHNTTKSHLSPRRRNHAAQISIHIQLISTLSPGSRKSNHWTKMCRIIYYSLLQFIGEAVLDIRMITCVCADSRRKAGKEEKLFTKNSWTDKLGPLSTWQYLPRLRCFYISGWKATSLKLLLPPLKTLIAIHYSPLLNDNNVGVTILSH